MESAAEIRSQAAVAAFDSTDLVTEYGLKSADPAALAAARKSVDAAVKEAIAAVDQYFAGMKAFGQNPYRESVTVGGKEIRFAAPVSMFAETKLGHIIERTFGSELRSALPGAGIYLKVERDIAARLKEYGFDVASVERHRDQSLALIAVRDPVYVANADALRPHPVVPQNLNTSAALDQLEGKGGSVVQHIVGLSRIAEATRWIDDFAVQAVATVAETVQAAIAKGRTPFEDWSSYYKADTATVVDRARVRRDSDGDVRVPRRCVIAIEREEAVFERFFKEFGADGIRFTNDLRRLLRDAIATRLRQQPELRAAVVVSGEHYWPSARAAASLLVVLGAELVAKTPGRWWRSFISLFQRRPTLLALPPPAAKPAALPPPAREPVVVGPVGLPKAFETEVR